MAGALALGGRDVTGLEASTLVALRPRRLVLHEVLVRVTADFSVPDGSRIEDLGLNFRRIVRELIADYVEPEMAAIEAACHALAARDVPAAQSHAMRALWTLGTQGKLAEARSWLAMS